MRSRAPSATRTEARAWAVCAGWVIAYGAAGSYDRPPFGDAGREESAADSPRRQRRRVRNRRADEHVLKPAERRRQRRPVHAPCRARGRAPPVRLRIGKRAARIPAADQDQRRRSAHRALGVVGPVGCRARAGGHDAGVGPSHQDTGHRQKNRRPLLPELKDKVGADLTTTVGIHRPAPVASDVLPALISLGYSDKEAVNAVKQLPDGIALADGIRQALKLLAKA